MLWGLDLVQLYNEPYAPFLGVKHPGRSASRPSGAGQRCGASRGRSTRPCSAARPSRTSTSTDRCSVAASTCRPTTCTSRSHLRAFARRTARMGRGGRLAGGARQWPGAPVAGVLVTFVNTPTLVPGHAATQSVAVHPQRTTVRHGELPRCPEARLLIALDRPAVRGVGVRLYAREPPSRRIAARRLKRVDCRKLQPGGRR